MHITQRAAQHAVHRTAQHGSSQRRADASPEMFCEIHSREDRKLSTHVQLRL
jgi:hypothetical protein